ncbi:MAG: alpha-L-rhamnosidase [Acidobacteria bacterium]|nr:alpha-L-rhamnosidase [Acidobacteriota bacterium]
MNFFRPMNAFLCRAGLPLFLSMCSCIAASAANHLPLSPKLVDSKWPASWIASPSAPARAPGVFYFRKEISIAAVPEHFWVHVTADNRFILHVNGKYVAEGPARGDLFHWRFETIDLAPYLKSGQNVVASVVWNFADIAPVAQMSDRTGFLMQGDTKAESSVNTGSEWRVRQENGRGAISDNDAPGYFAAGPAERIDGRELDWAWDAAGTDTSTWEKVKLLGTGAAREAQDAPNAWELVQDALPPMEHRRVAAGDIVRSDGIASNAKFPASPIEIPANSHVTILLDNHVLQTAYPELTTSGGRDSEIKLTYSEALYDAKGEKGNRSEIAGRHIQGVTDVFIADGKSARAFQPLWWRTWRFLQLEITTKSEPLKLDSLNAWFTAYPFQEKATIKGDIRDLDRLWETGWRTARLDAHETYMDAPYWEQLQYVGDTRIQALISYVVAGDSRLAKQAIMNIDDSRRPEGITESRYPSSQPQFIPTFSLLWINMLHDYWMYVDDLPLVKETVPHTRPVIDWYAARLRPDGLLGRVKWWEFADWTANFKYGEPPQDADGGSTFLTLQFIEALQAAEELEDNYGSKEKVAEYRAIISRAREAINRENWDGEHGLYADTPAKNSWSRQANVLAVLLDVAPRDEQEKIIHRLLAAKEHESVSFEGKTIPPLSSLSYYFRFYLNRAIDHVGMGDQFLPQLQPWYEMLDLGLSTWAETPEPTRSDCHAWSASPNYDLLTIIAGIHSAAPGFSRVQIAPHLTGLHQLDASMPLRSGEIKVTYRLSQDHWIATVTLPADLSGEFLWKGKASALHAGSQTLDLP